MTWFRLETFDKDGKIMAVEHTNLSGIGTVELAAKHSMVQVLKQKAQRQGYAFRVKREDE